ncbi:VWA domain-containing protein [Naumannella sp. ID2617S]|nr:VWA domain-containing protein [Naumannella sp. ID2617S]
MSLTHGWIPVLVLALLGAGWLCWRRRRAATPTRQGIAAANLDRVRSTRRFRELARAARRRALVLLIAAALLVAGGTLAASRLAAASSTDDPQHRRDIMLCLDVSGSMHDVDAAMLRSYADLVRRLRGERIGLTIFDSTAVSVFPLTDDYEFIERQLRQAAERIDASDQDFLTGTREGKGSSLIGDGVMSCLDRFDRGDQSRSRTMILATDNDLSGTPLFPLSQAFDRAVERGVVVHGIADADSPDVAALRVQAQRTGGQIFLLGDESGSAAVVDAINSGDASRTDGLPRARVADLPLPGGILLALGLTGLLVATAERRSLGKRKGKR